MTEIAKAVAFATDCLKWKDASVRQQPNLTLIGDGGPLLSFNPGRPEDLEAVLTEFLGNRYFIQVNRGTSNLFHWRLIVGLQDKSVKGASLDDGQAEGDDLWDAIFDACVRAAQNSPSHLRT